MAGESGPSRPKMERKGRRIRSGTPPGRVRPNHRRMTRNRPEMEQKGRKMGSGTAPELPKSVRGASGAPPDDENAGPPPKKKSKRRRKVRKKRSGGWRFHQKGLQKGGKNHEKTRKKVTKNRNGLRTGSGGVFHDFWDEKRR